MSKVCPATFGVLSGAHGEKKNEKAVTFGFWAPADAEDAKDTIVCTISSVAWCLKRPAISTADGINMDIYGGMGIESSPKIETGDMTWKSHEIHGMSRHGGVFLLQKSAAVMSSHFSTWVCLKIGYIPNYSHLKTG